MHACSRPACYSRYQHDRDTRSMRFSAPTFPTVSPITSALSTPIYSPSPRWERVRDASQAHVGDRVRAERSLSGSRGLAKIEGRIVLAFGEPVVDLGTGVTGPSIKALLSRGYRIERDSTIIPLPTKPGTYRDRDEHRWIRLHDSRAVDGKVWVAWDGSTFPADETLRGAFGPFKEASSK